MSGSEGLEKATLGGGCFWCLDAVFREVQGVTEVVSGYAGGHVPEPSYREVCAGRTGHAEVVQVEFDPRVVPYEDLLRIFFTIHDPTTPDRQGADVGPQYRSIILVHDAEQESAARAVIDDVERSGAWDAPVVTEVAPFERLWPAEPEHQDYRARNPRQPYCRVVIDPKLEKFRRVFVERRRARDQSSV